MKQKKVILAFSGGLDTSFCVIWLKNKGFKVVTLTVDTGGFSKKDKQTIETKAKQLGATKHFFVDAKKNLYDKIVSYIIKGNILRGGVYPLCAGPERIVIAEQLVKTALKEHADYIAHGSTGAGNDQIRFAVAINALSDLDIIAPIQEAGIGRKDEAIYLKQHGIAVSEVHKSYSFNKGVLGTTIGGKETIGSWDYLPESVYPGTQLSETPDKPEILSVSFEQGLPVALDEKKIDGLAIMHTLQVIGEKHSIGKGNHMGDTMLGLKGRVGFSAPAINILIIAHTELEKLVLTKLQLFWKHIICQAYGNFLHEALYFDPVTKDMEALIDRSQKTVTGTVKVKLFKGNIIIEGMKSPYSLMNKKIATYGEENALWNGKEAAGFCKLYGLQSVIASHIPQKGNV